MAALVAGCGAGEGDFALIVSDETVTLVPGQTADILVSVERINDFGDSVVVTASGLRAGITAGALSLRPGEDSGLLQLAVESSATPGPIDGAVVIGVSGDLERQVPVSLIVEPR
jgi:hypothetical protein